VYFIHFIHFINVFRLLLITFQPPCQKLPNGTTSRPPSEHNFGTQFTVRLKVGSFLIYMEKQYPNEIASLESTTALKYMGYGPLGGEVTTSNAYGAYAAAEHFCGIVNEEPDGTRCKDNLNMVKIEDKQTNAPELIFSSESPGPFMVNYFN
jgi:hypothetical protein